MKDMTIIYLIQDNKVCLGMKHTKIGKGKFVGCGGKIEDGETPIKCAIRETKEEFGVFCEEIKNDGVLRVNKDNQDYKVYIFTCRKWSGKLTGSDEITPYWFNFNEAPKDKMMAPDKEWFDDYLNGTYIDVNIYFTKGFDEYKIVKNY